MQLSSLALILLFVSTVHGAEEYNTYNDEILFPSIPHRPQIDNEKDIETALRNENIPENKNHRKVEEVQSCGVCCYSIVSADSYSSLDSSFYSKVIDIEGFLVASSSAVSDAALYEAALTMSKLTLERSDLRDTLVEEDVHMTVIGKDEVTTDVPEYSYLNSDAWDWTRGLGATQVAPASSCAEENLLCLDDDVYSGENICIHETAHSLQGSGGKLPLTRYVEKGGNQDLDATLRSKYEKSVSIDGLWEGTYAATNHEEYWAEGVQSFFDANIYASANSKAELEEYDNRLYSIISKVFPADTSFPCPSTTACDCSSFQCPSIDTACPDDPQPKAKFWTGKTKTRKDGKVRAKKRSCKWLSKQPKWKMNDKCSMTASFDVGSKPVLPAREVCTGTCNSC